MDESLLPNHNGGSSRSIERDDSKEMKEVTSDKQSEETGRMIERMSEYEILVNNNYTEPASGRHGNIRKKMIKDVQKQKRVRPSALKS